MMLNHDISSGDSSEFVEVLSRDDVKLVSWRYVHGKPNRLTSIVTVQTHHTADPARCASCGARKGLHLCI